MKTVRIVNGAVREIIPDYALPVEKFYSAAFCAQCVEAPDEVEQHWTYDPDSGTFSPPAEPEPEPSGPTLEDRVTSIENAIERGLAL